MRVPSLLLAAVALVAVAGCGGSEAGTPSAAPTPSAGTAAPSASDEPSSRPKDLDVAAVDPCQAVTTAQIAAWAVDRPPSARTMGGNTLLPGVPSCVFGSFTQQTGFLIAASPAVGLPEFLADSPAGHPRKDASVEGFPAVVQEGPTSAPERGSGECYALVDVADGQLLLVQFSQIAASQEKRLPIESLCAKAEEVAAAALTTLQGG